MTRTATQLDIKDPGEIDIITFDFTAKALAGETIVGLPVMVCELKSGIDLTPQNVYSGLPQVVGLTVLQKIIAGTDGNVYWTHCTATFTPTGRVLTLSGLLPVAKV